MPYTVVQFLVMDYDITNLKDVFTLIGSVLIFFLAWLICQSFLINISEAKANEEVDDDWR